MKVQKQLLSGKMIDLLHPQVSDVTFTDVVHPLKRINRFTGHTFEPVDVLRHSLVVAQLVRQPESVPYALVHDFHEAFTNDIDTPTKQLLIALGGRQVEAALKKAASMWTACIWEAMGLDAPADWVLDDVKQADLTALMLERRHFMSAPSEPWHPDLEAIDIPDWTSRTIYDRSPSVAVEQMENWIRKFIPKVHRGFWS